MSFYRQSPSRYHDRSPMRNLDTQRHIRQEINIHRATQNQVQNRRLLDEISLLKIKIRKGEQLEDRCIVLERQNATLAQQNDSLARQLSQKRYEIERHRSSSAQVHEREALKTNEVLEINRSLELEIELLKKERAQNGKLYETQFKKYEIMLEEKMRDLDVLSLRYNDLANEKEVSQIKYEEEISRLRGLMDRKTHDLERQFEYNKERQATQNTLQVDTLKKNYASQMILLQDEIKKLQANNRLKSNEFEHQLLENKNLKVRYEEQLRILAIENDNLRDRQRKLEDLNKNEVETIKQKYSNIHHQGQNTLIQQHNRQMKVLLDQIDKLKWLLDEKNEEIQNLVRQKRDQRKNSDEKQLEFTSTIQTLKNKLLSQEDNAMGERHELMQRINNLSDKLNRESQSYHARVKTFNERICELQAEIKYKQNLIERNNAQADIKLKQTIRNNDELRRQLGNACRELEQERDDRRKDNDQAEQYKNDTEREINKLNKQIRELEVNCESLTGKLKRANEGSQNNEALLKAEISSLRDNISILENNLSEQQTNHARQMQQLSSNMRKRIQELQNTQKQTMVQIELVKKETLQAITRRCEKLQREKQQMQQELQKYINMYKGLEKYFPNPHEGSLYEEKGQNNVYEVLSKVSKSSIHIF